MKNKLIYKYLSLQIDCFIYILQLEKDTCKKELLMKKFFDYLTIINKLYNNEECEKNDRISNSTDGSIS